MTKKISSRIRAIQSDLRKLSIDELDHVQSVTTQLRMGLGKESHAVGRHVVRRAEDVFDDEPTVEFVPSATLLKQSEAS